MPNTGWVSPGTAQVLGSGDVSWSDHSRILSDDASYASAQRVAADGNTDFIKGYNFNFSAFLSSLAQIDGVEVRFERYRTRTDPLGAAISLDERLSLTSGSVSGANKSDSADWPGSPAVRSLGGASDTCGLGLTATTERSAN